ncbi:MAG: HAMP domain-containing sensor histidine kinase [Bacteroidales bacterium]|nr:HAMP domain-containing sensor histidine kinase [Bacteroidales bacterium]
MKITYRYRVVAYFSLLLVSVTLAFALIYTHRERVIKIEMLKSEMIPYQRFIYSQLIKQFPESPNRADEPHIAEAMREIRALIPEKIRVTILTTDAWVLYDNFSDKESISENHLNRPELIDARTGNGGSAIRYSNTLKADYLYHATKYPEFFIRTALEYNTSVLPLLIKENRYMTLILIILAISIAAIIFMARRINKPVAALKEFIEAVQSGELERKEIKFPKDELGDVGEKIMKAFTQMEENKRYKQELTHNVAHELKTPVTGIRGYLETIINQDNLDVEQRKFFLDRAYAQTLRLTSIINDISILNKMEESPKNFHTERVSIRKCAEEIRSDLSYKLDERGIKMKIDIADDIAIKGSYMLIYSLFKNLVDNSIDHGGENISISIECTGITDGVAYFRYKDNGKGVPANQLERIFERFYRIEKGRSRRSGGSGLGLSIVKNAVLMHNGDIKAENLPEGGLLFSFSLSNVISPQLNA